MNDSAVAQVVVAGYSLGSETGNAATLVKLSRVALLAVVVALFALAVRGRAPVEAGPKPPLVPAFLVLFMLLALVQSTIGLPARLQAGLAELSQACLMMGVAALGMKTSFVLLARSGWRQGALMLGTTAWIGLLVLGCALWLGR